MTPETQVVQDGSERRQQDYGACEQQQQQQQQEQENAVVMAGHDAEPKAWEERGTVLSLILEVAAVAFSRVFILIALISSLQYAESTFMRCSQEETPELKNHNEVLLCHYTEAFLFTFPAMATTVLILTVGRDFLQKRMYYGLLKNGAVVTFSENKVYKDPLVLTLLIDFLHCVAYTMFHVLILYRRGVAIADITTQGLIPQGHVDGSISFLADHAGGGGPKFGGAKSAGTRGGKTTNYSDEGQVSQDAYYTVLLLITTFMETTLLIIFMWYAYDITGSLVPMSEYLDAYRYPGGGQQREPIPRLRTFKDTVAKHILDVSQHMIPMMDGDTDLIFACAINKYKKERLAIRGTNQQPTHHDFDATTSVSENISIMWERMQELPTIGLVRSMWPARLLLRRDVRGHETEYYRMAWVTYTILSMIALACVVVVLATKMRHDLLLLTGSRAYDQLLPLTVMVVHVLIVGVAAWSLAETLAPLCLTRRLDTSTPHSSKSAP